MRGATEHLRRFGMTAMQAVDLTAAALEEVLGGGVALTKDELGVALAAEWGGGCRLRRMRPVAGADGIGRNTYGQSLVRYALSVVSLAWAALLRSRAWHRRLPLRPDARMVGRAVTGYRRTGCPRRAGAPLPALPRAG